MPLRHFLFLACFPISIVLVACDTVERWNPTLGFEIGWPNHMWVSHIDTLIKTGVLVKVDDGTFSPCIRHSAEYSFRFYLPQDTLQGTLYLNNDGYEFGSLRSIQIELQSTRNIESDSISTFDAPIFEHEVLALKEYLVSIYGEPMSTAKTDSPEIINPLTGVPYPAQKFKNVYQEKWMFDSFLIEFYFDEIDDSIYNGSTGLKFQSTAPTETELIRDSILQLLTPDSLIYIAVNAPQYTDLRLHTSAPPRYEVFFEHFGPERKWREEARHITSIKYDLVYIDRFEEELYRIENIDYDIPNGLDPCTQVDFFQPYGWKIVYTTGSSIEQQKLERLRKTIDVKGYADIISVVFQDGAILK